VILVDLKTCVDASPAGFAKSIVNWRYQVQAAFYSDGWEAATGQKVHAFVFAAVEKEWPYAAAAYMLTDEDLTQGRLAYRRNLRTYAACTASGEWPGYSTDIQLLNLPAWAKKETAE
jgi:exodeoxyribonuclease VIII